MNTSSTHPSGSGVTTNGDGQRLLYSIPEAADQLSISSRVLERLIADGEVSSVKIGRRRLVPNEALTDYVARLQREA